MQTTSSNTELLTELQAAELLGVKPRTLRVWRQRRGLPHRKPTCKVIVYRRDELLRWLDKSRICVMA